MNLQPHRLSFTFNDVLSKSPNVDIIFFNKNHNIKDTYYNEKPLNPSIYFMYA